MQNRHDLDHVQSHGKAETTEGALKAEGGALKPRNALYFVSGGENDMKTLTIRTNKAGTTGQPAQGAPKDYPWCMMLSTVSMLSFPPESSETYTSLLV